MTKLSALAVAVTFAATAAAVAGAVSPFNGTSILV